MTVVIPVRFRREDLRRIDELVKSGMFRSRSEAIRELCLEAARSKYVDLAGSELGRAVEAILDSLRKSRGGLTITLEGEIAEFIAEDRERL